MYPALQPTHSERRLEDSRDRGRGRGRGGGRSGGRGGGRGGKPVGTKPDHVQLVPRHVRDRVRAFESAQIHNRPSAASKATRNPAGMYPLVSFPAPPMEGIGKRKRNPAKNPDGSDVQVNVSKRKRTS